MIIYLLNIESGFSLGVVSICGFSLGGAYPMLVSRARNARGMNLGRRMAIMVGGAWGVASVVLLIVSPIAEWVAKEYNSLAGLLHACWILLVGAGMYGIIILKQNRHSG